MERTHIPDEIILGLLLFRTIRFTNDSISISTGNGKKYIKNVYLEYIQWL